MTLGEASEYLKLAPITLYRKVRRGEIPAARIGKSWRFHRDQLEEWLKQLATQRQEVPAEGDPFRHLSSREAEVLLEFIGLLKSRYATALGRIVLYGSRARGDFKAYSDIDLLVTLRGDPHFLQQARREIGELKNRINAREDLTLQPFVLPEEEWRNPSFRTYLLVEKIRREGISLHV